MLFRSLAPGFYARQNIRTPVRIALITLAATQVMNALLVLPLRHAGLALAIGIGACLNAALLYRGLRRIGAYQPEPGWLWFVLRLLLASALMALALWLVMPVVTRATPKEHARSAARNKLSQPPELLVLRN